MPEVDFKAMYESISRYLDDDEADAQYYYETPTTDSVLKSLEAVGVDVDTERDKLEDTVNLLVYNEEWGSETAYQTIIALEDGVLTDAELYTILSEGDAENNIVLHVEARERSTRDEEEEAEEIIIDTTEEDEEESSWIDWVWGNTMLAPLESILNAVTNNIGERLENFIANALGIEAEE